jgi:hypothetical protein
MSVPIDFVLRANTAAFTKGLAAAENGVSSLKKTLRSFGGGALGGAIGIMGLIRGFQAATNHAQELRDKMEGMGQPVDDATRSVAEFGDALDRIKKGAAEVAVSVVSVFTRIGDAARRAMQGVTKAEEDAARAMERTTKKALDETLKAIEAAKRANSPEKMAEAERKLADVRRENAMRNSDAEGKLVLLLMRRMELEKEMNSLGSHTVARKEKEIELAKQDQAIAAQRSEVAKEQADAAEREAKQVEKIRELGAKSFDAADDIKRIKRDEATARADRYLPTIEDLAARAEANERARGAYGIGSSGSLVSALDPNSPEMQAKRALELEKQAREAAMSMDLDPVTRLQRAEQFQSEAEQIRANLSGFAQSSDTNIGAEFKDALATAEKRLEEINEAIRGLIKSQ